MRSSLCVPWLTELGSAGGTWSLCTAARTKYLPSGVTWYFIDL